MARKAAKQQVVEEVDPLQQELSEIMENVNSQYGDSLTFLEGTSGLWPIEKRIRTGSLALDMALGIGGWPKGRFNLVFGEESSGKTTMALHAVREAQKQGINSVYIDGENALDPNYMHKIGIDLKKLLIAQPPHLERAIDLMFTLMDTDKVGLIVFDSIAGMKSKEVMEADAENESSRAPEARRWSVQVPKLVEAAARSNTCILFVNQIRDSQNMYQPVTQPGGRTLKFAHSTMVQLKKYLEGKGNDEGADFHEARFNIVKNKVGSPYKKGSAFWVPGEPIDWVEDVIIQALKANIVRKNFKFEGGEETSKNTWFTVSLDESDIELMKQDDDSFLEEDQPNTYYEDGHFSIRYERNLFDQFGRFPSLLTSLEDKILHTLNASDSFVDSESESDIDAEVGPLDEEEDSPEQAED